MEGEREKTERSRSRGDDPEEDEISILDLLVVLARKKRTIIRTMLVFGAFGLLIAVFSRSEYTSSATVIREVEDAGGVSGSALDALRGFGFGLGGATTGLTADAYPDIVRSREVRLAVARDTFQFSGRASAMTFVEYTDRHPGFWRTVARYTIGLPGTIRDALAANDDAILLGPGESHRLSAEEEDAIGRISDLVRTPEDLDSGLMTISVTTHDPQLSVQMAMSFVDQLVTRVREIYTEKSRQNLEFIQDRFDEAERELALADSALAQFEDRNQGARSARLEIERQRLQRQVTFKSQLYTDLQTQLTQTQIELQRAEPVITVLERPVPPIEASGPRRLLTIVLFLILGGMVGIALAFAQTAIKNSREDAESRGKLDEIGAAIPRLGGRRRKRLP